MKKTLLTLVATMLVSMSVCAQTENGFKQIDVKTEFSDNPFTFFATPLLLCAGDKEGSNAMTIGWGAAGNVWSYEPCITVYVAEKRYTREFLEKAKYFTVMKISDDVLDYMGRNSGRNGDKAKALGLHLAYTANGAPYYTEATEVYKCEIVYGAPFDEKGFRNNTPKQLYSHFSAGIHSMYIGQVVSAWKE